MRRALIIGTVVLLLLAIPVVSLRVSTVRAISRIEALRGRTGDFVEILRTIQTPYTRVESPNAMEHARTTLQMDSISNLFVVRFNGEGLPYYYGFVAYDTNKQFVVKAVVDQLW
jgi:hypothetical protein